MNKNIKTINNLEKNLDNTRYLLSKLAKEKSNHIWTISQTFRQYVANSKRD